DTADPDDATEGGAASEPPEAPASGVFGRLDAWARAHPGGVELALFILALAPRLWVALRWAHEPVWDGHYYHFGAERIAAGRGYSDEHMGPNGLEWHPWCHYPVGYSGFLAVFYRLFGAKPAVAVVVQALVLAATASFVHRLARSFLSHRRALVAGLVIALHPGLVVYSALVMTEPLAGLGLVVAPLAFQRLRERPFWGAIAGGVLLGLTTLVRPQTVIVAPALALLAAGTSWKKKLAIALVATAACVAVVAPWTARNCARMDGCAFVSTNGGWNLAIGASPHATGRFTALHAEDGCRVVTGQVQQDRCWQEQGIAWIREDPVRWLALAPRKLSYTFDHQSFAVGYLEQADPGAWPEERRERWRGILTATQYALLFFAAAGAVLLPRGRRRDVGIALAGGLAVVLFADGVLAEPKYAWPLAVAIPLLALVPPFGRASRGVVGWIAWVLGTFILVHAVFFGEDRYQIVVTPLLAVLAAAGFRFTPAEDEPGAVVRSRR
ncbi:MAG TPA: glycosyltransferase family 39 protein, partial [Polyangiaceae bacterium]|nr:glycosyltransferase family 39 protein [Polyangiaceae bacterium]